MNPASEFPAFRPFPGLGNDALSRSAVERVFAGAGRNRVTGDYGSPYVVGTAAKAHRHGFHVILRRWIYLSFDVILKMDPILGIFIFIRKK